MDAIDRLSSEARRVLADEIRSVGGVEVLAAVTVSGPLGGEGASAVAWGTPRILARGNAGAAPAVLRELRPGDCLIHNHPSGILLPSEADLQVATDCGAAGIGFAITNNQVDDLYVVVEPATPKVRIPVDLDRLLDWFASNGPIARALPAHEIRSGQQDMLRSVVAAFNTPHHAVLEGGTGIGKSIAYLVPAIAWAVTNRQRVVVSTNTINLQHQLITKDLPLLARALPIRFRAELLKGRNNYLCRRRLADLDHDAESGLAIDPRHHPGISRLMTWVATTRDGTRSDLPEPVAEEVWELVEADRDTCIGARCHFFGDCFLFAARRRAAEADVVVVNHHLLCADLAARHATGFYDQMVVIPAFHAMIIDEAHHFEEAGTQHFGVRITALGAHRLFARLAAARGTAWRGVIPTIAGHLANAEWLSPEHRFGLADELRRQCLMIRDEAAAGCETLFDDLAGWLATGPATGRLPARAANRWPPDAASGRGETDPAPGWRPSPGGSEPAGEMRVRITDATRIQPDFERVAAQVDGLRHLLLRLRQQLQRWGERLNDLLEEACPDPGHPLIGAVAELVGIGRRLDRLQSGLGTCFTPDLDDLRTYVHFASLQPTRTGRPRVVVQALPLEVGDFLCRAAYQRIATVVMTSATLTVAGRFDFVLERLGLDRPTVASSSSDCDADNDPAEDAPPPRPTSKALPDGDRLREGRGPFMLATGTFPSPFDYANQARLLVPDDLPDPAAPAFIDTAANAIRSIIDTTRGGTLILCTAYSQVRTLFTRLSAHATPCPHPIFFQGQTDRHRLLEDFRAAGDGVLVATESFWEGIDVPGRSLRNLVIVKLPFAVPDEPVFEARQERISAQGRNAFLEYQLPLAVLKLKQGFGRLIRHRQDRGVAWILDRRVLSRSYGRQFLASLASVPLSVGSTETLCALARNFMTDPCQRPNESPLRANASSEDAARSVGVSPDETGESQPSAAAAPSAGTRQRKRRGQRDAAALP